MRLTGKELFIYYHKLVGDGSVGGCTNKVILAKKSGVRYDNLVRVFTRERKHYYENDDIVIMRLYVGGIEKGRQSMVRRGRGGMEKFRDRYLMGRREY